MNYLELCKEYPKVTDVLSEKVLTGLYKSKMCVIVSEEGEFRFVHNPIRSEAFPIAIKMSCDELYEMTYWKLNEIVTEIWTSDKIEKLLSPMDSIYTHLPNPGDTAMFMFYDNGHYKCITKCGNMNHDEIEIKKLPPIMKYHVTKSNF